MIIMKTNGVTSNQLRRFNPLSSLPNKNNKKSSSSQGSLTQVQVQFQRLKKMNPFQSSLLINYPKIKTSLPRLSETTKMDFKGLWRLLHQWLIKNSTNKNSQFWHSLSKNQWGRCKSRSLSMKKNMQVKMIALLIKYQYCYRNI